MSAARLSQRLSARKHAGKRAAPSGLRAPWLAALAQLVEHRIRNAGVTGSSPVGGTITLYSVETRDLWALPCGWAFGWVAVWVPRGWCWAGQPLGDAWLTMPEGAPSAEAKLRVYVIWRLRLIAIGVRSNSRVEQSSLHLMRMVRMEARQSGGAEVVVRAVSGRMNRNG